MKSTGIIRKMDDLGRIVIPMELRRIFGISTNDELEIFVDSDRIVLQKHEPTCVFCNSMDNLSEHKEKQICGKCLADLKKQESS